VVETVTKRDDNITQVATAPVVSKKVVTQAAPAVSVEENYLNLNFSKIVSAINEAKFYPRRARRLHIEGIVKIKFLLKCNKSVKIISVHCQKRFLKKATIKIIKDASSEFPKPPKDIEISVPIEFKLRD